MAKNHMIKFLVSKDQKEKILSNAKMNGYVTMSSYLRNLALNHNLIMNIFEIVKDIQKCQNKN